MPAFCKEFPHGANPQTQKQLSKFGWVSDLPPDPVDYGNHLTPRQQLCWLQNVR